MSTFDRDAIQAFRFVRCGFDADSGVAELAYAFDDGPELVETITIPGFEPRQPVRTSLPSPRAPKAAHRPHGNGASAQAPSQRPRRRRGGGGARPAAPSARS